MRRLVYFVGIAITAFTLTSCGMPGAAPAASPTSTPLPPPQPTAPVVHRTATPSKPKSHPIAVTADFKSFLRSFCGALSARDANTLQNQLPYYQYNSGVYYGTFDGAGGQTGQPTLISTWLQGGNPRCVRFSMTDSQHGAVTTQGWGFDGGWSVVEFDKYGSVWKINDFTFGKSGQVRYALWSTTPGTLPYPQGL